MMHTDFLFAVAEVGATYAGFSTLVAVVAYRMGGSPIPARIYYMLLLSLMVVAFAFVPAVIQFYGASELTAWKTASILYALVWISYWATGRWRMRRSVQFNFSSMTLLNKLNSYVIHPIAIGALLLSGLGVWGQLVGAVYTTVLFVNLYFSAFLFLQVVAGILGEKNKA